MTALNGIPGLEQGTGDLAVLPGLEAVSEQLTGLITVLRAEQARRGAGIEITRPAWKNLVFTGGPGVGKSRAERASDKTAALPAGGSRVLAVTTNCYAGRPSVRGLLALPAGLLPVACWWLDGKPAKGAGPWLSELMLSLSGEVLGGWPLA
jgi:hypothetical protein